METQKFFQSWRSAPRSRSTVLLVLVQVDFRFPKKIYGFPDFVRTGFFNLLNTLFAFLVERLQLESIVSVFLFVGESYNKPPREKEQRVGVGWWIKPPVGS